MKLPNPERAIVDIAKLQAYCLNPFHPLGKQKARVFAAALGLTANDAEWLRTCLLDAAHGEAEVGGSSNYGNLYVIDFELRTSTHVAIVRSSWIVREGEDFPRLTTCYVKRNR